MGLNEGKANLQHQQIWWNRQKLPQHNGGGSCTERTNNISYVAVAATTTATATAAVAQAAVHGLSTTEITMTTTNDKEMGKWQRDMNSINKL